MRTLVILGLVALVCSSPSFLRELQADAETQPANATNGTNSTNNTQLGTEGVLVNNSGVANHTDEFDFNMNLFEPNGNWTLVDSNCSQVSGDTVACQPSAYGTVDADNSTLLIVITYPNNPACQDLAGQTVNYTADFYIGEWVDNGLVGEGALRLNNNTIVFLRQDGNSSDAGMCYELWAAANATNATNDTNTTAPTNKTWEGAYAVYKVLPLQDGMEAEYCCIPDQPVLVSQDLATQTIVYAWRAPDCDACLGFRNSIQTHNVSIVGGGAYDDSYGVPSFLYPYDGHLIFEMPKCAYLLEPIPTTSCNANNQTNTTNATTDNNGGSR